MIKISPELLLHEAAAAAENSYSPYSHYKVGAALMIAGGAIVRGTNVENVSYGLSMCAERSAFMAAVSAGHRDFVALAIVAERNDASEEYEFPYPCGACRQVMAEFCKPDFRIYVARYAQLNVFEEFTLGSLLPNPFGEKQA
ncbi:MAG: cytidine deaminase [Lentisphaerae bacterium]|nr:cytidine deaminase [Lentisphaerota bacterium]